MNLAMRIDVRTGLHGICMLFLRNFRIIIKNPQYWSLYFSNIEFKENPLNVKCVEADGRKDRAVLKSTQQQCDEGYKDNRITCCFSQRSNAKCDVSLRANQTEVECMQNSYIMNFITQIIWFNKFF